MIGIRVDANSEIASGHMMRCFTIADSLKKLNEKIVFITADNEPKQLIEKRGYKQICLNSNHAQLYEEVESLKGVIKNEGIKKLIIDSYYVTKLYLETLIKETKVIYLDDLNQFEYSVNMLINYNIYSNIFFYQLKYRNSNTKLLLGCKFAPLRDEFQFISTEKKKDVKKILISTGGSDKFNVTEQILNKLTRENLLKGLEFHVLVGSMNKNELKEKYIQSDFVFIHNNVDKMSNLFEQMDVAISAGGFTLYELCACGIPTISFSFADNQKYGVEYFDKEGIIPYSGDFRNDRDICLQNMVIFLNGYITNRKMRESTMIKMKELIDGFGAQRIAAEIIKL